MGLLLSLAVSNCQLQSLVGSLAQEPVVAKVGCVSQPIGGL